MISSVTASEDERAQDEKPARSSLGKRRAGVVTYRRRASGMGAANRSFDDDKRNSADQGR